MLRLERSIVKVTEIHQPQIGLNAAQLSNPLQHCPPSTFLWLYPSRFMGKLQRLQVRALLLLCGVAVSCNAASTKPGNKSACSLLQTGPVLQAYYRFGPFDADPSNPRRLIPRAPDGPPLLLLSGLGEQETTELGCLSSCVPALCCCASQ